MKRAVLPAVLAILLALVFLLLTKRKNETGLSGTQNPAPPPPTSPAVTAPLAPTGTAAPANSKPNTGTNPNDAYEKCQQAVTEQIKSLSLEVSPRMKAALDTMIGGWYYDPRHRGGPPREEKSPAGKFLSALVYADLVNTPDLHVPRDDEKALSLLAEMRRHDPNNSAPYLFAALIERRRGNTDLSEQLLQQARHTTHFHSYVTDFTRELFKQVREPVDMIRAIQIRAILALPNYFALRDFLKPVDSRVFAAQMRADGLKKNLLSFDWVPMEYGTGMELTEADQKDKFPALKELLRKTSLGPAGEQKLDEILTKNCDINSLAGHIEELKAYFNEHP